MFVNRLGLGPSRIDPIVEMGGGFVSAIVFHVVGQPSERRGVLRKD